MTQPAPTPGTLSRLPYSRVSDPLPLESSTVVWPPEPRPEEDDPDEDEPEPLPEESSVEPPELPLPDEPELPEEPLSSPDELPLEDEPDPP